MFIIWFMIGLCLIHVDGYTENTAAVCTPRLINETDGDIYVVGVFNLLQQRLTKLYLSSFMSRIENYKLCARNKFTIGYYFYESCGDNNGTAVFLQELFTKLYFPERLSSNPFSNQTKVISIFYFGQKLDWTGIETIAHKYNVLFYGLSGFVSTSYNLSMGDLKTVNLFNSIFYQQEWGQIALLSPFSSKVARTIWERTLKTRVCSTWIMYQEGNNNSMAKAFDELTQIDGITLVVVFGSEEILNLIFQKTPLIPNKIWLLEREGRNLQIDNTNIVNTTNILHEVFWRDNFISPNLTSNFNFTEINEAIECVDFIVPSILADHHKSQTSLQSFLILYQNFSKETQNISFGEIMNANFGKIINNISCDCLKKREDKSYLQHNISLLQIQCEICGVGSYRSNKSLHTKCLNFTKDYLRYTEMASYITYSTMMLGTISTIFVAFIFIRYRRTPLVKSANLNMLLIQLVAHSLLYIAPIMFFGEPTVTICSTRPSVLGVLLIFAVAMIMTKTQKLVFIFQARIRVSRKELKMSKTTEALLILLMLSVQGVICFLCLKIQPVKVIVLSNEVTGVQTIKCGNDNDFILQLLFGLMLIVMCLMQAFRARNLPGNFSEIKVIISAMLSVIGTTIIFLPIRLTQNSNKGLLLTEIYYVLTGNTALFSVLHAYKCWVILYRPHKNTASVFRQNVRNHVLNGVNKGFNSCLTLQDRGSVDSNISIRTTIHDVIEFNKNSPQISRCSQQS